MDVDDFAERMLERAKARQKKIESHCLNVGETPRPVLVEPNMLLKKIENGRSDPNLSSASKASAAKPSAMSDSNIYVKSKLPDKYAKENLSDTSIMKTSQQYTKVTSEGAAASPVKTLNIQNENFNMEIKLTSSENCRVEVEIQERDDDNENDEGSEAGLQAVVQEIPARDDDENEEGDEAGLQAVVQDIQVTQKMQEGDKSSKSSKESVHTEEEDQDKSKAELRQGAKDKLQRLGKLYSDSSDISSPIHRTESSFPEKTENKVEQKPTHKKAQKMKFGKLAALADTINKWEDETRCPTSVENNVKTTTSKAWKGPAPKPPVGKTPRKSHSPGKGPAPKPPTSATKPLDLDPKVLDNLESQGFTRTDSKARLVFEYKKGENVEKPNQILEEDAGTEESTKIPEKSSKPPLATKPGSVLNKINAFGSSPTKSLKDPALLSLSERKALFEKVKGKALIPKAPFGMAVPMKTSDKKELGNSSVKPASPVKLATPGCSSGIAGKVASLMNRSTTISQSQILSSVKEQRQKEMAVLLNRFSRPEDEVATKPIPSSESESENEEDASETTKMISSSSKVQISKSRENLSAVSMEKIPSVGECKKKRRSTSSDSPQVLSVLEDVKRIRVSPPKTGRIYPCLSDIEAATETETEAPSQESSICDSDSTETSFGKEVLRSVCQTQKPTVKRVVHDDSFSSVPSDILDGDNNYIDEALADESDDENSFGPTPSKHGKESPNKTCTPSYSFNYKRCDGQQKELTPKKMPTEPTTHVLDGENMQLTHTISFYRRQQEQDNRTPVRQIVHQPTVTENTDVIKFFYEIELIDRKINGLLDEVRSLQIAIGQTSRALNLCRSTVEFSGSKEQVEAEKHLLVATHRRQAKLNEIQRLRVEKCLRPLGKDGKPPTSGDRGKLTITDITLPLKKSYMKALNNAGGMGHHVFCLIKYGENVLATSVSSTLAHPKKCEDVELKIVGPVTMHDVWSDFAITVEVYALQAEEEMLPHDVKYHINKKASGKITPKSLLKNTESKMVMPPVMSPAGPMSVRTSAFELMGYVVFSLSGANRKSYSLQKALPHSPLEGTLEMVVVCQLDLNLELRGFLNMFQDVSGFGAWHRRWFCLRGDFLSYWKYPDDEKKKLPIDSINLSNCCNEAIGPVARDICARPHTFLLQMIRPALPSDKESLVLVKTQDHTIVKYLLSADTKEDRIKWCEVLNKIFSAMRLWGNNKNETQH